MYSIGVSDNAFEVGDGSREPFAELYLRPPSAEQFACKPDVGTALSRVVRRQRTEDYPRGGARKLPDEGGEFEDGELAGIADVYRTGHFVRGIHHAHHSFHQVADVLETARL